MDKLLQLIPEIYYDIIARVIPGGILIFIVIPFDTWKPITEEDVLPISASALFLLSSYTCGLVLDACSATIEVLWDSLPREKKSIWKMLDEIGNIDKAKRPIKLVAELALFRVLLFGWIIVGIGWWLSFFSHPNWHSWLVFYIALVVLIGLYMRWYWCTRKRLDEIT